MGSTDGRRCRQAARGRPAVHCCNRQRRVPGTACRRRHLGCHARPSRPAAFGRGMLLLLALCASRPCSRLRCPRCDMPNSAAAGCAMRCARLPSSQARPTMMLSPITQSGSTGTLTTSSRVCRQRAGPLAASTATCEAADTACSRGAPVGESRPARTQLNCAGVHASCSCSGGEHPIRLTGLVQLRPNHGERTRSLEDARHCMPAGAELLQTLPAGSVRCHSHRR